MIDRCKCNHSGCRSGDSLMKRVKPGAMLIEGAVGIGGERTSRKSVNVRDITQINGRFLFLSLSVLSLRLAEECGRLYQLGSEGWRGLLAHSASNKFITPPSVKQPKMLTQFYFHAISGIWKSAVLYCSAAICRHIVFSMLVICYLCEFCWFFFVSNTATCGFFMMLGAVAVTFIYIQTL